MHNIVINLRKKWKKYIKLDSIFISTYIEAFKTIKQFKYLSFQIIVADQISCVFFNPPHLLSLKLIHFTQT